MAPCKRSFSLLWHRLIASQQTKRSFGNDTRTWWVSRKGCNWVTLDSILKTAFGFAVQVIQLFESCSPRGQVWQVQCMSGDKTGQGKQSGAGCGYVHTACVGSLHTLLPSSCHMHPFKEWVFPVCFFFFFPGCAGGEKGSSHPPILTQSDPCSELSIKVPGEQRVFPQKHILLAI